MERGRPDEARGPLALNLKKKGVKKRMRVRSHSPILEGWEGEAELSTSHATSSYGQLVLLIDGQPVGVLDAVLAGYEIIEATREERAALQRAGYAFLDGD